MGSIIKVKEKTVNYKLKNRLPAGRQVNCKSLLINYKLCHIRNTKSPLRGEIREGPIIKQ
jgi:hypothetical protein